MRLFVAVGFSPRSKQALCAYASRIAASAPGCRTTRRENLHLTLAFIGETDREREAIAALRTVAAAPFELRLDRPGSFKRPGGDICWLGANKAPPLSALAERVLDALGQAGFQLEERGFTPHLTMARQVLWLSPEAKRAAESAAPVIEERVESFSLMRSDRLRGVLTYTPVFTQKLHD